MQTWKVVLFLTVTDKHSAGYRKLAREITLPFIPEEGVRVRLPEGEVVALKDPVWDVKASCFYVNVPNRTETLDYAKAITDKARWVEIKDLPDLRDVIL